MCAMHADYKTGMPFPPKKENSTSRVIKLNPADVPSYLSHSDVKQISSSKMKYTFVLAALVAAVAAMPGDYVPFQPNLDRRCTWCTANGVKECCVHRSMCGTPGCNE